MTACTNFGDPGPIKRSMRSLGFRTHVLYALASAAGLVALARPHLVRAGPRRIPRADGTIGEMPGTISQFFAGL